MTIEDMDISFQGSNFVFRIWLDMLEWLEVIVDEA